MRIFFKTFIIGFIVGLALGIPALLILAVGAHGAPMPSHLPDGVPCVVVNSRLAGAWVAPLLLFTNNGKLVGAELAGGAVVCFAKQSAA